MKVKDFNKITSIPVITIDENEKLVTAIDKLVENNIGALLFFSDSPTNKYDKSI